MRDFGAAARMRVVELSVDLPSAEDHRRPLFTVHNHLRQAYGPLRLDPEITMSRPGSLRLFIVLALTVGMLTIASPATAAVTVTPSVAQAAGPFGASGRTIDVFAHATFSETAAHAEITVSFSGPGSPGGRFESVDSCSCTSHTFHLTDIPVPDSGGSFVIHVHWLAHNGNGLSAGQADAPPGGIMIPVREVKSRWTPAEKDSFNKTAAVLAGMAALYGVGAFIPGGGLVFGGFAALLGISSAIFWYLSSDPVDPQFTQIAQSCR